VRVRILAIGKSKFLRTKELGHRRSRNIGGIGTVHLEGHVAAINVIGKSPDKEDVHRCLVHRDIGDPGDKLFVHFGIAKRDTPMSGSQMSSQQRRRTVPLGRASCQRTRESGFKESGFP
jgi:hypothetical protein